MIQITQIKVPLAKVQQEVPAEALRRGILMSLNMHWYARRRQSYCTAKNHNCGI